MTTTARQIPMERESRTIFPLLTKPVTRTQVILVKFLGCWLACAVTLLVFYLFFGVAAMSKEHHWPLANYFQAMTLLWIMLDVVVAMALFGSLVFSAASANTTICFVAVAFILLLGRHLDKVAMQVPQPASSALQALFFTMPIGIYNMQEAQVYIHGVNWSPWLATH